MARTQVEFLTGQVAGAQAELSLRTDATGLLEESEQGRREVRGPLSAVPVEQHKLVP